MKKINKSVQGLAWILAAVVFFGMGGVVYNVHAYDGERDPSFLEGKFLGLNGSVQASAIQSDGKIIIVGKFSSYNGVSRNCIARLNIDGTLDTSFDPGAGVVYSDNTTLGQVNTIAIQNDGKILIGGKFNSYNGTSRTNFARLNDDGTLDTGFNSNLGVNDEILTCVIQPDGKAVIGGGTGTSAAIVARLNLDGSFDFNSNLGMTNYQEVIRSIAIQSDGKIIIGGFFYGFDTNHQHPYYKSIERLNADGTLDTSFNPGTGVQSVLSIAIQSDGSIIIGGGFLSYNGTARNCIARLNSDGSLDNGFNPGAEMAADLQYITAIRIQPDGKIIAGGSFNGGYYSNSHLTRINPDGSLDAGFNQITASSRYGNSSMQTISLQSDGKIFVGGFFTLFGNAERFKVARLNSDGTLDDDDFQPRIGADNEIYDNVTQSDGKIIIVGGFEWYGNVRRNSVARLNADGTLDTTFDPGTGADDWIYSAAIQPDGKILVAGFFTHYNGTAINGIARLNTDGSLDTTFDPGTGVQPGWGDFKPLNIVMQSDGKILLHGDFWTFNDQDIHSIVRLNTDGSIDTSFNYAVGVTWNIEAVAVQSDGKIIVGGNFDEYDDESGNATSINNIARLNADGTLDTSFKSGTNLDAWNIYSVAIQPNGKIIIGGAIYSYNGISTNGIARLNSDGTLDASFDSSIGADNYINTIAIQSNDKIIIGGRFENYNNIAVNGIARLNYD